MKKFNLFLVTSVILVTFLFLTGCGGGGPTTPPIEEDFINIISVHPESGLQDGVDTNFTVEVEYNLFTRNGGEVTIGFNNIDAVNKYFMEEPIFINKGFGTHEFNVTVKPKDWRSEGDFKVIAILDEIPWVSNYVLDADTKILTFL